ncbi:MAG: BolA/IbaG family iron-sulfur metabolism protein [Gammaproteobacteria bacterium]|nr:BolA/IbaG family iron-sulfur metabolism protein [Gammaproteobacteria bacterium]MBT5407020.1 BolA/IbaG family iron-sulfur metabolism protein [Gammaproteobacteria bacterium]MBT5863494.1 BolA/IbaG family iron-sulfur metabolism protein [Gammaproteobacteria bacterium]MBT6733925.1 BolA/IbaG family iron-sulfur metabolism protein [Gammaproteobacteria bacterium]MBT7236938.1 BolA/IbaG family iron-sulfur metabolism protein [Gammaproteobacteria bacterium]
MEDLIKKILTETIIDSSVTVEGGESKYTVKVISEIFKDKTIIERHKIIYAALDSYIKSGEIHALTIKSLTIDESNNI